MSKLKYLSKGFAVLFLLTALLIIPTYAATANLHANGLTSPAGMLKLGNDIWVSDHVNGFCRLGPDTDINGKLVINASSCESVVALTSPGQPSFDETFVYVPDNAGTNKDFTGVWRFRFFANGTIGEPALIFNISAFPAFEKPSSTSVDSSGNLYIGFIRTEKIVKITTPGTSPTINTNFGTTSNNARPVNSLTFVSGRGLYLAEGAAVSLISNLAIGGQAINIVAISDNIMAPAALTSGKNTLSQDVLFIADTPFANGNTTILRYNINTNTLDVRYSETDINGIPFLFATGLLLDNSGNLFIGDDPSQGNNPVGHIWSINTNTAQPEPATSPSLKTAFNLSSGITAPGGQIFIPGAQGGHYWVSDHVNGFCRLNNLTFAIEPATCAIFSVAGVSPGQPSYDAINRTVFVPDNAATDATSGVWRIPFNSVTESLGAPLLIANINQLNNNEKPTATAFGPDGSLYVGFIRSGNITQIANASGTQIITNAFANTSNGLRPISGLTFIGTDLYIAESAAISKINITSAPPTAVVVPQIFVAAPGAIASDGVNKLFVADTPFPNGNSTIRRFNLTNGVLDSNYANIGLLGTTPTRFKFVSSIAIDPFGNILIGDDPSQGGAPPAGHIWAIENEPPITNITSVTPQTINTRIRGIVDVNATATDVVVGPISSGIERVEFYANTTLIGSVTTPFFGSNYSLKWNTNAINDGIYVIKSKAFDKSNNTNVSVTNITVVVDNNPPVIILNFPLNGTVSSTNFAAIINGSQEVPPTDSTATGKGTFVINRTANTLSFNISYIGLLGTETAAHIHGPAMSGVNASVLFALPVGSPKIGVWNYPEEQEANILSGLTYVNIHSDRNASGEIRGQILPAVDFNWTSTDVSPPILSNLSIDGVVVATNIATNNSAPTIFTHTVSGFVEGSTHTWSITSQDELNNSNTTSAKTFVIDNIAPSITVTNPLNNSMINIFNNSVSGTISEVTSNLKNVTLMVNGVIVHNWTTKGLFNKMVNYIPGTTNQIIITATDTALLVGNMNTTILNVNVTSNMNNTTINAVANQLNTIDARNNTSTLVSFILSGNDTVNLNITGVTNPTMIGGNVISNITTTPSISGLVALGKYVSINASGFNFSNITSTSVRLYYLNSDLDLNGNGILGEVGIDIDESSLRLYKFNATSNNWTKLDPGVNTVEKFVFADMNNFSVFGIAGTVVPTPAPQPGGGGGGGGSTTSGGGGGGGGGASGENYTNIIVKEKYDKHIFLDKVTSYMFTDSRNPIMFVNITGNINAGVINVAVEVLRGVSTLIQPPTEAPGVVNQYANIWVGTSGFSVPKNIQPSVVRFKVENTWLENNKVSAGEIKLVRWDGSKWEILVTKQMEKDSKNTYFEATTDRFSPFAIAGIKEKAVEAAKPPTTEVTKPPTPASATPETTKPKGTPGAGMFAIASVFGILYLLYRKRR